MLDNRPVLKLGIVLILGACNPIGSGATLETFEQKSSYAIGLRVGESVAATQAEIDLDALVLGIEDVLAGESPRMTGSEIAEITREFSTRVQSNLVMRKAAEAVKNQEEGAAFLAENGSRPEVTTTESGLQYEAVTPTEGQRPTEEDRVTVHYLGTLLDGTKFDSSYDRGEPATFALRGVIPGWTEGLQVMTVGSKYKFYIPSNLAYAQAGSQPKIGPDATLIFEVELISIESN